MLAPENLTTNLVRRPSDGLVTTTSGRRIPQPPWIIPDQQESVLAYDQWLIDQGREEAAETGDIWMTGRLAGACAAGMSPDLRMLLSDYLFGRHDPEFEARQA